MRRHATLDGLAFLAAAGARMRDPGPWLFVCFLQRDGWTPFRIAQRKGHADVAAVLAEVGGR
jgi:hypothetical protein